METLRIVEVRIDGRITPSSVLAYTVPLLACLDDDAPVRVLFDRRTTIAPTPAGRAAFDAFVRDQWPRLAPLVVAWADVYDPRRARSLERARRARAERGEQRPTAFPYAMFDDLAEGRAWLAHLVLPRVRELVDAG